MKRIFILYLYFAACIMSGQLPTVIGYTVIPQNPTPADQIKIVTEVMTPNQGIIVDLYHSVNSSTKEIFLTGCYWQGMATAVQVYIDTFMIGQLPAGSYNIYRNAYMSSTQQHCTKTDSNKVANALSVSVLATSIGEKTLNTDFRIYPNPCSGTLFFTGTFKDVLIYSGNGSLIKQTMSDKNGSVDISDVADGLYFIRVRDDKKTATAKFIKQSSE